MLIVLPESKHEWFSSILELLKIPFSHSETLIKYMLDLLFIIFISFSLFAAYYVISSVLFSISPIPSLAMSNLLFNLFFYVSDYLISRLSTFFESFCVLFWVTRSRVFLSSFICLSFKICFYSLYHIVLILEILRGNNLAICWLW